MVRSVRWRASVLRFPGVTKREENVAATMRRPGKYGASERTTVSTSGSSGKFHQNLAVLHFHWIGGELQVFVAAVCAGAAIEFPSVIGATENRAVERAVSQRAAGVRTDAVHGVERAADVAHRHRVVAHFNVDCGTRRQLLQRAHFYKSHSALFVPWGQN